MRGRGQRATSITWPGLLGRPPRQEILVGAQRGARTIADGDQDLLTKGRRHIAGSEQPWLCRRVALVDPDEPIRVGLVVLLWRSIIVTPGRPAPLVMCSVT